MGIVDEIIEDEGSIAFSDLSTNFNEKRRKKKGEVVFGRRRNQTHPQILFEIILEKIEL